MSFPRLFDDGQYTMDQYQNNLGMGTLIDATSCKVTEELNGEYELELTYDKQFSTVIKRECVRKDGKIL